MRHPAEVAALDQDAMDLHQEISQAPENRLRCMAQRRRSSLNKSRRGDIAHGYGTHGLHEFETYLLLLGRPGPGRL